MYIFSSTNVFVLTKINKDYCDTRTIGIYRSLSKAEDEAKIYIELFNSKYPERKIYIRSEMDHPERNLNRCDSANPFNIETKKSCDEVIYCKTIWYTNIESDNQNIIFKIEEFQIE